MQRINVLRKHFASKKIEATGNGKAVKSAYSLDEKDFSFLQLTDFLQEALVKCDELGILPIISVGENNATMTVYDVQNRYEPIIFSAPSCKVETNGQDLQGIGAQITYNRRYLWYLLLEICVHDSLDEGMFNNRTRELMKEREEAKSNKADGKIKLNVAPSDTKEIASATPPNPPEKKATNSVPVDKKAELTTKIKNLKVKLPTMTKEELVTEVERMNLKLEKNASDYDAEALRNILNRICARVLEKTA